MWDNMGSWIIKVVLTGFALVFLCHSSNGGETKVSWKECNIDPSEHQNCGYQGISEEKCYVRGCCWAEHLTPDSPSCYYSQKLISEPRCMGQVAERSSCGFSGIRKDQCLAIGCCWQPKNDRGVPWCYEKFELQIQGDCGVPAIPPKVGSKVVGGIEAKPHSWPWQASLQYYGGHICGASIINEYWLVSAAHCEFEPMTVALGMHSVSEGSDEMFAAEATFAHAEFGNVTMMDSDIMLIKLRSPITFSDKVSPVCLPDQDEEVAENTRCYITGWGTIELWGEMPDKLQQAPLPIIGQETCQDWYAKPKNWYEETNETFPITDTMLCAGYKEGGRSGCHGDSGGPFVCHVDNVWKLFGAVSWGAKCGFEEVASIFAKVSHFRDWIERTIENNS